MTIVRHWAGKSSLFLHHTIGKKQAKMKKNCLADLQKSLKQKNAHFVSRATY